MAIAVTCPICGKKLAVPDKAAGKQCKCPQCHESIAVPSVTAVPIAKPHKPPQPPETEPEQDDDAALAERKQGRPAPWLNSGTDFRPESGQNYAELT
jgi:hypothetical protein